MAPLLFITLAPSTAYPDIYYVDPDDGNNATGVPDDPDYPHETISCVMHESDIEDGDVMIGAHAGRALVYSGKDWSIIHEFAGTMTTQGMGNSISRAGDIDEDLHEDVLVGASGDTTWGINDGGGAYLFSGKDGALIARVRGEVDFLRLGTSVHGGEDVNSDGLPDWIRKGRNRSS